jgi:hypothetical protein
MISAPGRAAGEASSTVITDDDVQDQYHGQPIDILDVC